MQRRAAFREVRERSRQLVAILLEAGPARMHNVDELLLKESMDVIGALPALPSLHSAKNMLDACACTANDWYGKSAPSALTVEPVSILELSRL